MADIGMLFWQENIKIIENIFNVEFEKQEKNIANLISASLKTRMDEIKKTQDEMKKSRIGVILAPISLFIFTKYLHPIATVKNIIPPPGLTSWHNCAGGKQQSAQPNSYKTIICI